ncbi:hypothetical protein [Sphingomonas mesophila]|nr:hypothetical protein [Sphingomonas mesophila]
MKMLFALAAVLTSAALTVPTVSGREALPGVTVASAGAGAAPRAA